MASVEQIPEFFNPALFKAASVVKGTPRLSAVKDLPWSASLKVRFAHAVSHFRQVNQDVLRWLDQ